jgi:hypothetical protein
VGPWLLRGGGCLFVRGEGGVSVKNGGRRGRGVSRPAASLLFCVVEGRGTLLKGSAGADSRGRITSSQDTRPGHSRHYLAFRPPRPPRSPVPVHGTTGTHTCHCRVKHCPSPTRAHLPRGRDSRNGGKRDSQADNVSTWMRKGACAASVSSPGQAKEARLAVLSRSIPLGRVCVCVLFCLVMGFLLPSSLSKLVRRTS